jgi:hypothetical protein
MAGTRPLAGDGVESERLGDIDGAQHGRQVPAFPTANGRLRDVIVALRWGPIRGDSPLAPLRISTDFPVEGA